MDNTSESLSNQANLSRESPLTMDSSSEVLPNSGPPDISHHEENVV